MSYNVEFKHMLTIDFNTKNLNINVYISFIKVLQVRKDMRVSSLVVDLKTRTFDFFPLLGLHCSAKGCSLAVGVCLVALVTRGIPVL